MKRGIQDDFARRGAQVHLHHRWFDGDCYPDSYAPHEGAGGAAGSCGRWTRGDVRFHHQSRQDRRRHGNQQLRRPSNRLGFRLGQSNNHRHDGVYAAASLSFARLDRRRGPLSSRGYVSKVAFGNTDHAFDIGVLSVILLFGALTGGQGALLQGMRQIGDLARMNILGTAFGAILSIPIVYLWGRDGIAAYMVLTAATAALVSWRYARRIRVEPVEVPLRQVATEARKLLQAWSCLCLDRIDVNGRALPVAHFCDA